MSELGLFQLPAWLLPATFSFIGCLFAPPRHRVGRRIRPWGTDSIKAVKYSISVVGNLDNFCQILIRSYTMTQPWVQLHDLESEGQLLVTASTRVYEAEDIANRQIQSDDDEDHEELPSARATQELSPTRASSKSSSVEESQHFPFSTRHDHTRWSSIQLRDWWLETLSMLTVLIMLGTIVLTFLMHDGGSLAD